MIGLITRYRKNDVSQAALAILRRLNEMGRTSNVLCYDWRASRISPAHDSKFTKQLFGSFLEKVNHIIWTAPVDPFFLEQARYEGIKNTLWCSWEQFEPLDEYVLEFYHHVLVPSLVQALQLREKFRLRNVAVLPYYPGLPISRKTTNCASGCTSLFLSLYGSQLRRVDLSAIFLLADIVRSFPSVSITVSCDKGLSLQTMKQLKKLDKQLAPRWQTLYNQPWHKQVIEMAKHDLTIWPARFDGFGIIGVTSLYMGTPVIAFDITPISEYLSAGRNSILVSSELDFNWLGMPYVQPDYEEFDRVLRWLLQEDGALDELRKHTNEKLVEIKDSFDKGLNAILPVE